MTKDLKPIGINTRSGSETGPRRPASALVAPVRSADEEPVSTTVSARKRASLSRSHLTRSGHPSVIPVISSKNQNRPPSSSVSASAASTSNGRSRLRNPSTAM